MLKLIRYDSVPLLQARSEQAVQTLWLAASIVQAVGTDALAAGVVEPPVLRGPHRLAGHPTVVYGHAVIKIDDPAAWQRIVWFAHETYN